VTTRKLIGVFKRNLTTEEIVFQYILASREGHKIDNVVYMGMGSHS